jgi:DNA-binding CsgD family transcriptional regulator
MKNKYMHHSHLSERKFRELLRLFAADPNAVQMAEISGVSRQTVSTLLARMRERIGEIEID